ncbi:hypothetical protein HG536_0A02580 [Torulaspora globosa]|uniref:DUF676 domain-containing protein n=1 Tax=Torulaspora globosa TaxID=48254 RepID=A0A7G3ZAA5_9SACH|nr:uncharacterized protein HG536_0A02580 [Torulaspora globosa]QLL30441.1 hypothetical protein HG536_0A02580 [Torulaspora globosa]
MSRAAEPQILFNYTSAVGVGELERYVITYDLYEGDEIPPDVPLDSLWLRVKNMESLSYRAAYLMGPFILYCDVRTEDYHHSQKIIASVDQPKFEPTLQAQQSCIAELSVHRIKPRYVWIVDIVSQILFTTNTQVTFQIVLGNSKEAVSDKFIHGTTTAASSDKITVSRLTTLDIWNLPAQINSHYKKKHLVVLTHGLHSNVSADMAYMMEQIYKAQGKHLDEQIVVKGYTENICQTERGVKYLGTKLAKYIIEELYDDSVTKISLIGHSLGGLVQAFAIAYITVKYPWFFDKVQPINFVAMASPFLGIVTDNPAYINLLLSFGVIGKAGQDLSLEKEPETDSPLLALLPGEPVKNIMARFKRRTLYMNAVNDGIVPLYTASMLFLDYEEVLKELKKLEGKELNAESSNIDMVRGDFLNRTVVSPFTKMLGLLAPQKFPQSRSTIPKVSFLESAVSLLIPPLPDKSYILDPSSRDPVIIHDKIYTADDIPPEPAKLESTFEGNTNILLSSFTMARGNTGESQKMEESIARQWHDGLSWRKVVVALKPDAHNNIIVRRRFANAYGWPVLDHLVDVHFSGDTFDESIALDGDGCDEQTASGDPKVDMKEPNKRYAWITRLDNPKLFDEGPTGMISTIGEMLGTFVKDRLASFISSETSVPANEDKLISYEYMNGEI